MSLLDFCRLIRLAIKLTAAAVCLFELLMQLLSPPNPFYSCKYEKTIKNKKKRVEA